MKIARQSDWEEIYNDEGILGYSLITHENTEIVRLVLEPNAKILPHSVPFEAIFVVLNGAGSITVDNENHMLFVNDSIFVDANAQRGWTNTSDEPLEIQVIKKL